MKVVSGPEEKKQRRTSEKEESEPNCQRNYGGWCMPPRGDRGISAMAAGERRANGQKGLPLGPRRNAGEEGAPIQ